MKNKLMLLVSMLLPIISGCGEKPTVEPTPEPTVEPTIKPTIESSENQFKQIDNLNIYTNISEGFIEPMVTPFISDYSKYFNDYDNYLIDIYLPENSNYICGYIDNSIYKQINDSNSYLNLDYRYNYFGINQSFAKYYASENIDKNLYPIIYYEIEETNEISLTLNNKNLVIVGRNYVIDIYDLNNNKLYSINYFNEEASLDLYKNTKDIDLKIKLNDSLNNENKYLFVDVMNKNEKEKWENHLCISPGDIYNYFKVFSNEIIEMNNEKYISLYINTFETDSNWNELLANYSYIKNDLKSDYYFFKWTDICSLIN